MDNFMDKLAHKLSAQDVIQANSQAETLEMERLKQKVAEYERILQEMRKLNVKNVELSEKIDSILDEKANQIKSVQDTEREMLAVLQDLVEEQTRNLEQSLEQNNDANNQEQKQLLEQASKDLSAIEELIKNSDEFTHKENVKVYRNVQAVLVDEMKKQTEELISSQKKLSTKINITLIFSIFSFVLVTAIIVFKILMYLQF